MRQVAFNRNMLKNGVLTALLGVLLLLSTAQAQNGGDYILEWSTIDGGGGQSSGGGYVLSGTIGQPDAGRMASCAYHLSGGFWSEPTCLVDLHHFAQFSAQWLQSGDIEANLDDQGIVDILDLYIFVSHWLCYCPGDWPF